MTHESNISDLNPGNIGLKIRIYTHTRISPKREGKTKQSRMFVTLMQMHEFTQTWYEQKEPIDHL